jgi:hypothetical protein
MTRRRKSTALAVAALVMGLVAVVASRTAEPRYQGRKLSSWLQQGWQTSLARSSRRGHSRHRRTERPAHTADPPRNEGHPYPYLDDREG